VFLRVNLLSMNNCQRYDGRPSHAVLRGRKGEIPPRYSTVYIQATVWM